MAGLNARMMADGKKIYFTRDEKGANRLRRATLGPNGTAEESEALFPADAEPIVPWFDVSPDGQLLAFTDRGLRPRSSTVVYGATPMHIVVAGSR